MAISVDEIYNWILVSAADSQFPDLQQQRAEVCWYPNTGCCWQEFYSARPILAARGGWVRPPLALHFIRENRAELSVVGFMGRVTARRPPA